MFAAVNRDELVRSYLRRPPLAARKAADHALRALACQDRGELDDAVAHWDRVDDYHYVLDQLVCCRRCGRHLTDPESVARRIGPECATKVGYGCVICGGTGTMTVPDPLLGDYIDADCFCAERPRSDNAISGEVTDPAGAEIGKANP